MTTTKIPAHKLTEGTVFLDPIFKNPCTVVDRIYPAGDGVPPTRRGPSTPKRAHRPVAKVKVVFTSETSQGTGVRYFLPAERVTVVKPEAVKAPHAIAAKGVNGYDLHVTVDDNGHTTFRVRNNVTNKVHANVELSCDQAAWLAMFLTDTTEGK